MAEETKPCSFFLVRYVPDIVRDEGLNIGLFLYSPQDEYLDCLFTEDFRRVRALHPQADMELLHDLPQHFEQEIKRHEKELEKYIQEMQEGYSNLIQVTTPRPCLATDPQAEMQSLFTRYVGTRAAAALAPDTRMRIKQRLTDALRRHGVLDHPSFERRVPAAQWTTPGDPFTFDYGYRPLVVEGRPNGHLRLTHALSLRRDNDLAKALRWTFERAWEHEKGKGAETDLSVVHEDLAEPIDAVALSSRAVLEDARIRLIPVAQVDGYTQSIRRELTM